MNRSNVQDPELLKKRLQVVIAGKVVVAEEPVAVMREWRERFEMTQAAVAQEIDLAPTVISSYENGHRSNPGVDLVNRFVYALLECDEKRGGETIATYAEWFGVDQAPIEYEN